ncbi:hypothetical protein Tco_1159080, partial [Tanacetum coccineum]
MVGRSSQIQRIFKDGGE